MVSNVILKHTHRNKRVLIHIYPQNLIVAWCDINNCVCVCMLVSMYVCVSVFTRWLLYCVLTVRSRPIVSMVTNVTFTPPKIPTSIYDCTGSQQITASVCFSMTKATNDIFNGTVITCSVKASSSKHALCSLFLTHFVHVRKKNVQFNK